MGSSEAGRDPLTQLKRGRSPSRAGCCSVNPQKICLGSVNKGREGREAIGEGLGL